MSFPMEKTTMAKARTSRPRTSRGGLRSATALLGGMVLAAAGLALPSIDVASAATGGWKPTSGALTLNRSGHTATLLDGLPCQGVPLPSYCGKVLMVGGSTEETEATAELYDPTSQTFSPTTSPMFPRDRHTATPLRDGKVLVVGGSGPAAATAEIYDPASRAWLPVPPPVLADTDIFGAPVAGRWNHTATVLGDGKVLVAGGAGIPLVAPSANTPTTQATASALIYDPVANTWAKTGRMQKAVHSASAVLLRDGKVLVAGGAVDAITCGSAGSHNGRHCGTPTSYAQIFDLSATDAGVAGVWTPTDPMNQIRKRNAATLLDNGKVLVAGRAPDGYSSEVYDPDRVGPKWAPVLLAGSGSGTTFPDYASTVTRLDSGAVLLVLPQIKSTGQPFSPLENGPQVYDAAVGSDGAWTKTAPLHYVRADHTATLLLDGTVLAAGGRWQEATASLAQTEELYVPSLADTAYGMLRVETSPPVRSQISVGAITGTPGVNTGPDRHTSFEGPGSPEVVLTQNLPRNDWGLDWLKLPARVDETKGYNVCFSDVPGFITPPCQQVTVKPDVTTTVVGTFTPAGYLRVITDPPLPSTIFLDGIARNDMALWSYFPVGAHEVCFGPVAGYLPPPCQAVTLTANTEDEDNTVTVTGTFTADAAAPGSAGMGMLRVTTSPALPAQISIDGIPRNDWGLDWLKLPPGRYIVSWSTVLGFSHVSFDTETVTIKPDETREVTARFSAGGFLRVVTQPPLSGTISVGGVPMNDWGMWTSLPPGSKDVCFGAVAGFVTPACQKVTLTPAGNLVTGVYRPG